jgi:DNA-binding Lrp family transcriptional regulator
MSIEVLEILEKNSKISAKDIAAMIGATEDVVSETIERLEHEKVIIGYNTLINWEKTTKESVDAFIEVKVTPQRGEGFDKIAERIYKFPEVKSLYLMSGGFDLVVMVEGKTMKEVALFVGQKLAPLESVLSTGTHFVLKKYKDKGIIFEDKKEDKRMVVSP